MCLNRLPHVIWVMGIISFMSHSAVHVRGHWGVEGMGQWIGYHVWHALLMWLLPVLSVSFAHELPVSCILRYAHRLCTITLKCDRALVAHLSHSMDHHLLCLPWIYYLQVWITPSVCLHTSRGHQPVGELVVHHTSNAVKITQTRTLNSSILSIHMVYYVNLLSITVIYTELC